MHQKNMHVFPQEPKHEPKHEPKYVFFRQPKQQTQSSPRSAAALANADRCDTGDDWTRSVKTGKYEKKLITKKTKRGGKKIL